MANMIDYILWRGDLTCKQDPFNAVDNLILSQLVYMTFDQVLADENYDKLTSLSDAVHRILNEFGETERISNNVKSDIKNDRRFLTALAESKRFGSMQLTRYVNRIDYEAQKQFCAMTVLTGDDSAYVAFRGTDDSLVGWKENFNMSFMTPVPAQQAAVDYLEEVFHAFPESLRIGGHSKGGNLAVYAAAFCEPDIQDWITDVYNNDGPGFDTGVMCQDGYQQIHEKIHAFVPQSSVVGMLLEHGESYTVIHSTEIGLMQHAPYSWEVLGNDFVRLEEVDQGSKVIDRALHTWLSELTYDQREQFVDGLYQVLASTNAKTAGDISSERAKSLHTIFKTMRGLDEPTKKLITQTVSALLKSATNSVLGRE